jgi:hypothetical protein
LIFGHRRHAILDRRPGLHLAHQEEAYDQQQQRNSDGTQVRRLPVISLVICFVEHPGAILLHGDQPQSQP